MKPIQLFIELAIALKQAEMIADALARPVPGKQTCRGITDSNYSVILASLLHAWKERLIQYLRLNSGTHG
ncbi:hypothetical protein [Nitrosomonas sp.]|uniref:hypothetical protein n=1 Tax=Nitrosomonas sp. TaxID=42353 RepID=UPI00374CE59E